MKVWENEKCCGDTSRRRVLPELFRVLPNFLECFYNSIGTWRTCLLFLLENTATKKKKNNMFQLRSSKCKFSLFAPSLRQQLVLVLCFYRAISVRICFGLFSKIIYSQLSRIKFFLFPNGKTSQKTTKPALTV